MGHVIAYLVAIGVAAFVVSLPLGKWRAGAILRRVAALCAVLALLPSLIVAIIGQPHGSSGGTGTDEIGSVLLMAALAVLSLGAWAFLAVRRWLTGRREKPRAAMMRRYRHRTDNDFLDFLERFNREDRDA